MSPPLHGADDDQRLHMTTFSMDNLMSMVNPDGDVYSLASQETHIAYEGLFILYLYIFFYIICIFIYYV